MRTRPAPVGAAATGPATTGTATAGAGPTGRARLAGLRARRPGGRLGRLSAGRIAVLVLVVVTLVVSAALPLREFVSQRGEIAALARANAEAEQRVAALTAERERLDDPDHIAAEARRRLHFVLPGETAYVVIPPAEPQAQERAAVDQAPWFARLWDSVEEADRPATAP